MTKHLSAQRILQYRARALAPTELLALDQHLESCDECRAALRNWIEVPAQPALITQVFADAAETSTHYSLSQSRAYLDNRLDAVERELFESHCESCADCQNQLVALQTQVREPVSGWRKLMRFDGWFEMPLVWRVAGAMALLGVLLWGVTRWRQATLKREEIASSSPTVVPSVAPSAIASATPSLLLAIKEEGQSITLDAQGNLSGADSLTSAEQVALKVALTTGKIEKPRTLGELRSKNNLLMSGSDTEDPAKLWAARSPQTLQQPFGIVVAEARPTFRWKPLAGATHYQVIVSDPGANFREAAASPKLTRTSWTPPQALPRDRVLNWQVIATLASGQEITAPAAEAAEARFRLLSKTQFDELTQGRQRLTRQHLPLALLYARLGLISEAERELRAVAQTNPSMPILEKMLRDLRN